jgi:hypothetical protein
MAYVAARRRGRFEIRESLHTPKGSRARSLVGFQVLDDEVLARAAQRAVRRFDADAVIASGRRAGAPVTAVAGTVGERRGSATSFVRASRRMALSLQRPRAIAGTDPGEALIDLLGFADAVARSQSPRPFEPLQFPVMARLTENRRGPASRR